MQKVYIFGVPQFEESITLFGFEFPIEQGKIYVPEDIAIKIRICPSYKAFIEYGYDYWIEKPKAIEDKSQKR